MIGAVTKMVSAAPHAATERRAPEARNVMTFPSLLDAVSLLSMKRSPRTEGSHPIYARNRRRAWQGGVRRVSGAEDPLADMWESILLILSKKFLIPISRPQTFPRFNLADAVRSEGVQNRLHMPDQPAVPVDDDVALVDARRGSWSSSSSP
jgi:hypothetical protein